MNMGKFAPTTLALGAIMNSRRRMKAQKTAESDRVLAIILEVVKRGFTITEFDCEAEKDRFGTVTQMIFHAPRCDQHEAGIIWFEIRGEDIIGPLQSAQEVLRYPTPDALMLIAARYPYVTDVV